MRSSSLQLSTSDYPGLRSRTTGGGTSGCSAQLDLVQLRNVDAVRKDDFF
jgi:hypothetical protein